jgi:hypothetical protein
MPDQEPLPPLQGSDVRFPPGRVRVRLDEAYRWPYRRLYNGYRAGLDGLPVLRDRDFDGRAVLMTRGQLEALNRALASLAAPPARRTNAPYEAQEDTKKRLFKRLQFLS